MLDCELDLLEKRFDFPSCYKIPMMPWFCHNGFAGNVSASIVREVKKVLQNNLANIYNISGIMASKGKVQKVMVQPIVSF